MEYQVTTAKPKLTFEDYLAYDDGTDIRYELEDGELVEMPPESPSNCLFSRFLFVQFLQFFPLRQVCMKDTEIEVAGRRAKTRFPDVMILSEELALILQHTSRSTITRDMPPPLLVAEVVSKGKENQDRDYRYKRSEYAARGIEEYWIIDPHQALVIILSLVAGLYEETVFQGSDAILSPTIAKLQLTPAQIFQIAQ